MSAAPGALSIGVVCFPSFGGSGVIGAELGAGLARRGHRVHVIASAPPSRPLPDCDHIFFHEVAVSDYPLFQHPPYESAVASTIVEVAEEHHLDVVHAHYAVPHASCAYMAKQILGAQAPRFVTTLHGTDVTRFGQDPSFRPITRFSVAALDGVTVPSAWLGHEARRILGLDDGVSIDVIPNFVDTEHFTPAEHRDRARFDALFAAAGMDAGVRGPVLFHVSNFRAVKRVLDLVEVLARVRATMPARLVLVGDGPERAHVAQRARELGVARHVCFLGKRADFVELLRHADVFLLTSESESFGVAALEALSAGVPVVAYRVGGVPEVVTDDCGRLVAPFDVDAFAAAVVDVVGDPARHETLARAGRARATRLFRREPAIERYEALFRRLLSSERR
ncbi:N-acetyl-alpha-D-glucosaminyl L-malate synthase BshA [Myxococcota bacterium]|nr:N-acetyl-alpha-D-glucosaminyl L-malate synthase BshA [Myxococcota bacterium]